MDLLPEALSTGIYFGLSNVDQGNIFKTVLSIGWNPFYHNTKKSLVSEKMLEMLVLLQFLSISSSLIIISNVKVMSYFPPSQWWGANCPIHSHYPTNYCLVGNLSIFYRYFNGHCSQEIRDIIPVPLRHVRTTRGSTHSHPFQVSLPNPLSLSHNSFHKSSPLEHAIYGINLIYIPASVRFFLFMACHKISYLLKFSQGFKFPFICIFIGFCTNRQITLCLHSPAS